MDNINIMNTESKTVQIDSMPTKASQKLLNMIFIVDTSGSMRYDGRIEAVNEAFRKMIPDLRRIQIDVNTQFQLKIAILTFDQYANWIVKPTDIQEYDHHDIVCSPYVTYYSEAFKALREKLTRNQYMAHDGKIAAPYIMFMTDGAPTENDDYPAEMDELEKNGWFNSSQRFAVLIGSDTIHSRSARDAVKRFVTNEKEGIIDAEDAVAIAREVEANTLRTVNVMTGHPVTDNMGGVSSDIPDDAFGFGDFGGFGDPDSFDDSSFI